MKDGEWSCAKFGLINGKAGFWLRNSRQPIGTSCLIMALAWEMACYCRFSSESTEQPWTIRDIELRAGEGFAIYLAKNHDFSRRWKMLVRAGYALLSVLLCWFAKGKCPWSVLCYALGFAFQVVKETWGRSGRRMLDYTVYTGALGTAYLLFKAYQITNNKDDLYLCSEIIKACDTASRDSR